MLTMEFITAIIISSVLTGIIVLFLSSRSWITRMLRFRVIKDDILQHIADTINVAYFVVSKDWRKMFFVSKAYEEIYGKSLEELYHNPVAWFEAIHPDDKDIIIQKTSEYIEKGLYKDFPDYRIYRPDGSLRWISTRLFPLKGKRGEFSRIAGFAEDITERKTAEFEKKRTEELYRNIVNNSPDVVYRSDLAGNILMVNKNINRILEYEPEYDFIGKNIPGNFYYYPSDRERLISELKEKGEVSDFEVFLKKKNGTPVVVSSSSHYFYDGDGKPAGIEGVLRDITARKRAEDLFNKAFNENPCAMSISDIQTGLYIEVNRTWLKLLEMEREEVIGHTAVELGIYRNAEDRERMVDELRSKGRVQNAEIEFVSKYGKERIGIFFGEIVEISGKNVLLSAVLHVTEQRVIERKLRESEERFRRLAENAPDVIYRMKLPEGIYEYMSPSSKKIIGYTPEEIYSRPMLITEAIHPDWLEYFGEEWNKLLNGEISPYYEYKCITPEGKEKWLHQRNVLIKDDKGIPIALEGIVTDVTDSKNAEEELILKNAILAAEQDVSLDGILIVDDSGRILLVNRMFFEIWRISEEFAASEDDEKLLQQAVSRLADPEQFINKVEYLYSHPKERSSDELFFKDGRTIERYSAPVTGIDGKYFGRVWYFRDITERRESEENLRRSEEKFRRLAESAPIGIFLTDPGGGVIYTNPKWQSLAGITFEESLGYGWIKRIHPDDREKISEKWSKVIREKKGDSAKFRFILNDGSEIITFTIVEPVFDTEGNVVCYVGTNNDITETEKSQVLLKDLNEELTAANEELMATNEEFEAQNEELIATNLELQNMQSQLSESEKEYRSLIENITVGITVLNKEGEIILYNPTATSITEGINDDMKGKSVSDSRWVMFNEDGSLLEPEQFPERIVLNTGKRVKNKVIGMAATPEKISKWILCDAYPEYDQSGDIYKVIVSFIDITERKKAEQEIFKLKNYMSNIIDSIPDILVGIDGEMNVTLINRKTEKSSGLIQEDVIGRPVQQVLGDFAPVIRNIKQDDRRSFYSVPDFLLEKDGEKRYYNIMLYPLHSNREEGAVVRIEDVTDVRRIDEQLRQAQKMETVGTLAGGLAHDFNNVLSGIVGTVSLIKHQLTQEGDPDRRFVKYIDIIDRSGKRASEMVQQLLTLSRRYEISMNPLDINEAVSNVMQICRNTFDKSIELSSELSPEHAVINGDISQIEQVILNLCVNASHAMTIMRPEGEIHGGSLTISVRHIKADRYFCSLHPEAVPGWYWMISHSDTGVGMDEETIKNIFDPFFTTKDRELGTGLGLAMVYSIIHHHKGFIDVYSEINTGTTFNIYLPEIAESEKRETADAEPVIIKGEGTILIIDDEDIVRMMAESILKECGYNVISSENGREGLDIYRETKDVIDAVLLDMAMPGMSGKEVYLELKKINPEVKVLLASGFRQDHRVVEATNLGINGFIQKPYSLGELSQKIKDVITGNR